MGAGSQSSSTNNGTTKTMKDDESNNNNNIPLFCQFWVSLSLKVKPIRINIIGKTLDVSIMILSAIFLFIMRHLSEFVMVYIFNWPYNSFITKNAAASVPAIIHSMILVPSLAICFYNNGWYNYNPSQKIHNEPTKHIQITVNALLQLTTGYMIYDGLLNLIWLKIHMQDGGISVDDYMFLGHHLATIVYMTSTRIIKQGHQSAMMCMFLGELTNPLHNSFYITQAALQLDCCNGQRMQYTFQFIEISFSLLYVCIRTLIGPIICLHMTYNLLFIGRKEISNALIGLWVFLIWAVIIGSIPWVQECWETLQRYFPTILGVGEVKTEL